MLCVLILPVYLLSISVYLCLIFIWDMKKTDVGRGVILKYLLLRSGTLNSNTVNSKFHLIRSFFEILAKSYFKNVSKMCSTKYDFNISDLLCPKPLIITGRLHDILDLKFASLYFGSFLLNIWKNWPPTTSTL